MTYKGIKNTKLLILKTSHMNEIKDEEDLMYQIKDNLNSVDFDLVQDGATINIEEFNIITDNRKRSYSDDYIKIYQIFYTIDSETKKSI